ncbi:hypothetical protein CMV_030602, partial [Castanea mollissima]
MVMRGQDHLLNYMRSYEAVCVETNQDSASSSVS